MGLHGFASPYGDARIYHPRASPYGDTRDFASPYGDARFCDTLYFKKDYHSVFITKKCCVLQGIGPEVHGVIIIHKITHHNIQHTEDRIEF